MVENWTEILHKPETQCDLSKPLSPNNKTLLNTIVDSTDIRFNVVFIIV